MLSKGGSFLEQMTIAKRYKYINVLMIYFITAKLLKYFNISICYFVK